jgi:hypothetical protein
LTQAKPYRGGVKPVLVARNPPDDDALAHVIDKNLRRSHLTPSQRWMIAAKIATRGTGQQKASAATLSTIPTADEAAKMMGVGVTTVTQREGRIRCRQT